MKYIEKRPQPQELIAWVREQAIDRDGAARQWGYDDMPAPVRDATKACLLAEQGGLCCYTGRKISKEKSHIEHLKPQSCCIDHEDTNYHNLLAAYPSSDPYTPHCCYGAHARGNWYHDYHFVHPRRRDCEQRFRYRDNGTIAPEDPNDQGARETIDHLHLNHRELTLLRKASIDEALFAKELRSAQVERLRAEMDRRDDTGNYPEYCFVIKQACERYLRRFD